MELKKLTLYMSANSSTSVNRRREWRLISEQDDFRPAAVGKIDPAPDFLTIGIEIDDEQAVLWGDVQQLFKGDAPCGRYDTGDNHAHQKAEFLSNRCGGPAPGNIFDAAGAKQIRRRMDGFFGVFSKTLCRFL